MPTVAYRTVRSRQKFSQAEKVRDMLGDALDSEAKPMLIKRFNRVVANWSGKPTFKARKFVRVDKMWIDVFPAGEHKDKWKWVSRGTRPHKIAARNAPMLAFMWGGPGSYKPKTTPGGGYGGPGAVVGGKMHFRKSVNHPGNAPREFEEKIAKEAKPEFSRLMENAWRRIIRRL